MMKQLPYLFAFCFLLAACGSNENGETKKESTEAESQHEGHKEGHHAHHNANEYMHQSSVPELIERFESEERDAYQKPEAVIDFLGDLSGLKIMDIGAGSGYFSVKLAAAGAEVIAADVNEEFQAFIKDRIEKEELSNIETRMIAYDDPGLSEGEVDKVLIVNTYHHIEDRPTYFSKVRDGINEGGELVVIDFFKKETPVGPPVDHKIAKDQVIRELKEAGFTTFEVNEDLLDYQYIIRASK